MAHSLPQTAKVKQRDSAADWECSLILNLEGFFTFILEKVPTKETQHILSFFPDLFNYP